MTAGSDPGVRPGGQVNRSDPGTPLIVGARITGGHEGLPELILKIKYENGVVSDVAMENDMGVALLAHCGADDLDALVGEPWSRVLEILDQRV